MESSVEILQAMALVFLAWGGFLAIFVADRRSLERDRRTQPRPLSAGRRHYDTVVVDPAPAANETPPPPTERRAA